MKGGDAPTKGGPSGTNKGNQYEIINPTVTDHLVHDDDEEDELEAIYNIDGTLNRFQQRGTTVDLRRGPIENAQLKTKQVDASSSLSDAQIANKYGKAGLSDVLMGSNQNGGIDISGRLSSIPPKPESHGRHSHTGGERS